MNCNFMSGILSIWQSQVGVLLKKAYLTWAIVFLIPSLEKLEKDTSLTKLSSCFRFHQPVTEEVNEEVTEQRELWLNGYPR